jgi:hypothetical protein
MKFAVAKTLPVTFALNSRRLLVQHVKANGNG